MKRRLRLPERAFLRFDGPTVPIPVPPHAAVTGDPSALDLEDVQALGAADDEVDFRKPLARMSGRLERVTGHVAIVESAAQSLEYSFLRQAAGLV